MRLRRIYVFAALFVALGVSAYAQSWSSGATNGLTSVELVVAPDELAGYWDYTFTLTNLSGLPDDSTVGYDILVWSLQPFNLPGPNMSDPNSAGSIVMPGGSGSSWQWEWDGNHWWSFSVAQANQKYFTPPALAPDQSFTFSYRTNLTDPINDGGPSDGSPAFLTHVAAVVPDSGSATDRWDPYSPPKGQPGTWADRSIVTTVVPEPGTLVSLTVGVVGLIGLATRKRRR